MIRKYFKVIVLSISLILSGCTVENQATKPKNKRTDVVFNVEASIPGKNKTHLFVGIRDGSYINTVIKYDPHKKISETLAKSIYHPTSVINNIRANEDWLIYTDSTVNGAESTIFAINLKTKEKFPLQETDDKFTTVDTPFLYDKYAAWAFADDKGKGEPIPKIVLYNLQTKEKKIIARTKDFSLYNNYVHINDGKVLWTDSPNNKGEYHIYHIESGKHEVFQAPYPIPGYAELADDKIFSLDFVDYQAWDVKHIGCFDIKTKKYEKIPLEHGTVGRMAAYGNQLAYVSSEAQLTVYERINGKWQKSNLKAKTKLVDTVVYSSIGELITVRDHRDERLGSTFSIFSNKKLIIS